MDDKPVALDAYEALADAYAAAIETKPHNAYYERPATLSLPSGSRFYRGKNNRGEADR